MKINNYKIFYAGFLLICFLFAAPLEGATVPILFLGDLDSQLLPVSQKAKTATALYGGLVHGAALIERELKEAPTSLVLQGGNAVSGPLWLHFAGGPEFSALEAAGVQAFALGNHEFVYGAGHLKKGLANTSMIPLASNLAFDDPYLAGRVKKYALLKSGETTVGVFAIASARLFDEARPGPGVRLNNHVASLAAKMVGELRELGAEVIVVLSRLTSEQNCQLASSVEGIHALLGNSDMDESEAPSFVKGPEGGTALLASAGGYGVFLGKLSLTVENHKLVRDKTTWELLRVRPGEGAHDGVEKIALEAENRLNETLLSPVGFFQNPADATKKTSRTGESPLGNFLADAVRWRTEADIGMINGGGVRGDKIFPRGIVTRKTLTEILPFNNPLHIVSLKGSQIEEILELSASALQGGPEDPYDPALRPPGGAFLQLSGVRVEIDPQGVPALVNSHGKLLRPGSRVKAVFVEKEGEWVPIDREKVYTVAVNSWTADGGDRLYPFAEGPQRVTDILDIDALDEYFKIGAKGRAKLEKEGRIVFTEP